MKTHLGHYEIVDELGRGGMGVVYKGFEPALGRHVAIKELSPSLAHDPNLVERFLREARSMAALNDPHIIQIYFIGTDEATGQPFFAMEFVDGESLSGLLKRDGKLSVVNALRVLHQTAMGLATAHDRGVIHRDIKPGNLMITAAGRVKIADFGIALATQDFSKKLTSTGEFVGTPGYLSPEVCTGKTVDQRSDIFSLGIVLYEMLTGTSPFTDESPLGLMLEVVKAEIPDIRGINAEVDADTAAILAKMLAKEPGDRYQNCHALVAALEAHPLLGAGGTIRVAMPKPAPSDATVIGAPTPGSQPQVRAATPPPVVRTATPPQAQQAIVPTAPSASLPAPAALAPPPRRSKAPLIAVAAVLLVLVGAGAAAFTARDYLQGVIAGLRGDARAVAGASGASSGAMPAGAADAGSSSTPTATAAVAIAAPVASDGGSGFGSPPESSGAGAASSPDAVSIAVHAVEQEPVDSTRVEVAAIAPQPAADAPVQATKAAAEPARPVAAAAAQPQARREAAPSPPRIAVVALGDPALTGVVRQQIEERLAASGFDLVDASLLVRRGADLAGAMQALRGEATVAVVIQTEDLGSRELKFYGRSDIQYSANLSVRAYQIAERRPLGPGFAEQVDFTTLNARSQAEAALDKHASRILAELSPFRRRG